MNNETFLIEEADLEYAKSICKDLETTIRNRAVANVIGAKLASKYFVDIEADTESGLHNICNILKDYEISDIYIKNNYIDVRLYFNENEICVPKSHFDNGMLPSAYMFIKVDSTLTNGLVTGFAIPSEIDLSNQTGDYYSLNENDLVSFYDVDAQIIANYEDEYPEEFETQIFDYLDNKLDDKKDFFNTLFKSRDARIKLYNASKANDILSVISIPEPNIVEEESSVIEIEENETSSEESSFELLEESSVEELELSEDVDIDESNELTESVELDLHDESIELLPSENLLEENNDVIEEPLELLSSDNLLEEENVMEDSLSLDGSIEEFEPISLDENETEDTIDEFEPLEEDNIEIGINFDNNSDSFSENEESSPEINNPEEEEFTIKMVENYEYKESEVQFDNPYELKVDEENSEEPAIKMVSDYDFKFEEEQPLVIEEEKEEPNFNIEIETEPENEPESDVEPEIELDINSEVKEIEEVEEPEIISQNKEDTADIEDDIFEELSEGDLDNEFSTSTTPSINSLEEDKENKTEEDDSTQEIDELFGADETENNLAEQYNKQVKKGNKLIPLVVVLAIIAGVGYYSYTKFFANKLPENDFPDLERQTAVTHKPMPSVQKEKIEEAMPIETVENVKKEVATNEGNSVSIPAIEQNLNASILVSNLSVNWEVPAGYVSSSTAKRYFNKMGKIIQLNLKSELLLLSKPPITNKIAIELEFNKSTQKFEIKDFTASSGEKSVDDIIRTTVNKALNINLNMNMNTLGNIPGNPVLIIKL